MNMTLSVLLLAALNLLGPKDKKADADNSKAPKANTKITAASTYYDRKEGYAYFNGHVFVDDEKYKLHADRAYVFMKGTNELHRIVAIGNVAMTNDSRRAYGAKASYYRDPGMVVLYSGEGVPAIVKDVTPKGEQVVQGKKIKFWTDVEQVEVLDAELTAPASGSGVDGIKGLMRK